MALVTLKEIAGDLGVSVSTVSRVLTDKDKVDPSTRQRVKDALVKYNYVPNEVARVLRGSAVRSIGMIVPTLKSGYYTRIITAAQDEAIQYGYTIVVCASGYDRAREMAAMRLLSSRHLTGVLCASNLTEPETFYTGFPSDLQVVFFDCENIESSRFGYLYFDAEKASYELTSRLLKLGHRRVVLLNHCADTQRESGFLSAADTVGGKVIRALDSYTKGYVACERLLTAEDRPTAIVATNDFLTYAAVKCARNLGWDVPGSLSVAGFDNCDDTGILDPPLCCVMQDTTLIGGKAVAMMLAHCVEHCELPYRIVDGGSVAKPKRDIAE